MDSSTSSTRENAPPTSHAVAAAVAAAVSEAVNAPPQAPLQVTHDVLFSTTDDGNPALLPVLFEWTQKPATTVGITGSFNNWGPQIQLKQAPAASADTASDTAPFAVTLFLPIGVHFFKFCVDSAWKYDPEVAFAPDEYGNLNNFIKIVDDDEEATSADRKKPVQRPIQTIIRDTKHGLPVMNPLATIELQEIRMQTSPVLRPGHSPHANKSFARIDASPTAAAAAATAVANDTTTAAAADAKLTPLRPPQETMDAEYDIHITDAHVNGARSRSSSTAASILQRVNSDKALAQSLAVDALAQAPPPPAPKLTSYLDNAISSSVLLAATTQHFGGDLVTYEHSMRQQLGGHRSVLVTHDQNAASAPARRRGKMILFLVGLPGRGKTFIGHVLARHLTWMGHQSTVFNTGEYRRKLVGVNMNHAFWDPLNEESQQIRSDLSKQCLDDAIVALESDGCDCVIFDATNATRKRRTMLRTAVMQRYKCEMMFIESICESPELIASSINAMNLGSEDYACRTMDEAAADYNSRILHYQSVYEHMDAKQEDVPFIQIIDVGRQIFCNQIYGYLQSRIMFLMANLQLRPRPIWLSRHGESQFNTQKRIGGDAALSPLGMQYAAQLDRFIHAYYPTPDTELAVWTSTMLRTGMTVERIAARGRSVVKWKQLDEIDAGICDGMTYEQVADEMPDEYLARKNNKLNYRYPRGESYQDVIHRLEPVITELMRMDRPVLIVAHQAILRVLYAYLTNKAPAECPTLNVPLHVVIQLTPKAYQCEEVWHRPM